MPICSSEKLHGQRSLVDYSPWVHTELDVTERMHAHTHTHTHTHSEAENFSSPSREILPLSNLQSYVGNLTCVRSVTQSCPTLHDPLDCSRPGSSVHGVFHARILQWLPFPPPGDTGGSNILPGYPLYTGIEPAFLVSPALHVDSLPAGSSGKPLVIKTRVQ